jgi:SAM-dependent methyltransferase
MSSCRICDATTRTVLDLGDMPLANKLKTAPEAPEKRFPLALEFCAACGNLQLGHCVEASDLYDDYLYITPTSPSLEAHSINLVYHMQAQGYLPHDAFVLEFGSNIGHFLKYARSQAARVLGIDPARAIVEMANARGVPTVCDYFGPETAARAAAEHGRADIVVGRHCAAHNADPHALITGARLAMKERGVFVMENACGLNTVLNGEIGQIYHEHMYYYTAWAVRTLFPRNGLDLIFGAPKGTRPVRPIVAATIACEKAILTDALLDLLPATLNRWRTETRALLDRFRESGRTVWLYGGKRGRHLRGGRGGLRRFHRGEDRPLPARHRHPDLHRGRSYRGAPGLLPSPPGTTATS